MSRDVPEAPCQKTLSSQEEDMAIEKMFEEKINREAKRDTSQCTNVVEVSHLENVFRLNSIKFSTCIIFFFFLSFFFSLSFFLLFVFFFFFLFLFDFFFFFFFLFFFFFYFFP
jgi:hypothetical protein